MSLISALVILSCHPLGLYLVGSGFSKFLSCFIKSFSCVLFLIFGGFFVVCFSVFLQDGFSV